MVIIKQLLATVLCASAVPALSCAASPDAAWKQAGSDEGLRQAFERATYSLKNAGHGTYRGENPAHQLTLEFNAREVRLGRPDGSVNFHLTGYGYGDRTQKPAPARLSASGNRLEYQRGDLTEWYVNDSEGLEQGFTLSRHSANRESEPLMLTVAVSGELTPVQNQEAVQFRSSQGVVFRYGGLRAWDANGRNLTSRLEVRGDELRLIVDDRDAQYPVIVDPSWARQQELTASDAATGDEFGLSVAVDGDTAVIGAPDKTIESHKGQGAAYVFVRSAHVWTEQQELHSALGYAGENFGLAVALSGSTVVIGANEAAYVFVNNHGVWVHQQKLTGSSSNYDSFGQSVAVSGNTAVIGDRTDLALRDVPGQGAAYVFVRSGGVWTQQQKLSVAYVVGGNNFGSSVAVSGDTALIGDPGQTVNTHAGVGSAYVYLRNGEVWTQQQELIENYGGTGDHFGASVALSGGTALIGTPGKSNLHIDQGAPYVFVRNHATWTRQQELTAPDGSQYSNFGMAVSVSGDNAIIGGYFQNKPNKPSLPALSAAYVFLRSGEVWAQQAELKGVSGPHGNNFGISVSLSGDTALIGDAECSELKGCESGAAYVYTY
jgi:hypothetical protein